jgi:hypothetical protein
MKLDLAKDYDKVSWLHLIFVLIQIGMRITTVIWIMVCITFASILQS